MRLLIFPIKIEKTLKIQELGKVSKYVKNSLGLLRPMIKFNY